jgi:Uma2 family endonuclease
MKWDQVCKDKSLQNLPYKIELNEWGNIVMSPASNRHGNLQTKIAFHLMSQMPDGTVLTECSVDTAKGVKVADVAWVSDAFLQRNRGATPYVEAPEVCVEIQSPSNSDTEMAEKRDLYFAKGAREYWLCDEDGKVSFFSPRGKMEKSLLFPDMLAQIEADA